jgi:CRP-like cAMP-binding protein
MPPTTSDGLPSSCARRPRRKSSVWSPAPGSKSWPSDTVGRYLMSHIDQGTRGLTKMPIYPYRGPVLTSAIREFRDGPFRKEHSAIGTSISNEGWRHIGPQATAIALIDQGSAGQRLHDGIAWRTERELTLGSSAETLPDATNRIVPADTRTDAIGIPRPRIHYRIDDYAKAGLSLAMRRHEAIFALDEFGALILVCTIGASLATTALEIGAEIELEPNHELRAHGLANLASALVGGIPAFTLAGPSLTYLRLGASSRLMPILRAVFTLALGVAGLSLLGFVPKIMVGTLLILFSFGLVDEWLIRARHRLGFSDYVFVLIIAGIIALVGFLPGVGAGILIVVVDFLIRYSKLNVIKAELSGRYYRSDVERSLRDDNILHAAGERLLTFEIQGFIFFGTAIGLLGRIRASVEASTQKVDYIILGFANVDGLDAAAHFALRKLSSFAKAKHICLLFSGLTSDNTKALQAADVLDEDQSLCFANTAMAVEYVENSLLKLFGGDEDAISAEDALVAIIGERDKAIALLPYFTDHDIRAGDQVFRQGDDADGSILLVRGSLSAHLDLGGGQSVRLRKFLPGTLMGEMAFYTGRKRSASLMADTDATIGVISGESILRLNRDQPAVAAEFHQMAARLMAYRIISMNAMLRTLLTGLTIPTMLGRANEAIE